MEFLKSMLENRLAITAGTIYTKDLPVNPVSFIDVDLDMTINAAYTPITYANMGAAIAKLEILYKGSSIISLVGADLLAFLAAVHNRMPPVINRLLSAASVTTARFRIPFGRYPYSQVECFPAVRKGEWQIRITWGASFTNISAIAMTITTCELMGAAPKQFLKATTISVTPVVGEFDVDLPLGNKLIGILLFSTTVPAGTAQTTSVDMMKLLVENTEHYWHQVRWPDLNQRLYECLGRDKTEFDHIHRENVASAFVQNANTGYEVIADEYLAKYGLMDFDPMRNDAYLFDTHGLSRAWLRPTGGDTNVVRVIPIEIIELGAAE